MSRLWHKLFPTQCYNVYICLTNGVQITYVTLFSYHLNKAIIAVIALAIAAHIAYCDVL